MYPSHGGSKFVLQQTRTDRLSHVRVQMIVVKNGKAEKMGIAARTVWAELVTSLIIAYNKKIHQHAQACTSKQPNILDFLLYLRVLDAKIIRIRLCLFINFPDVRCTTFIVGWFSRLFHDRQLFMGFRV